MIVGHDIQDTQIQHLLYLIQRQAVIRQRAACWAERAHPRILKTPEELDQRAGKLPHIDLAVVRGTPQLFRREIILSAAFAIDSAMQFGFKRQAEICQDDSAV